LRARAQRLVVLIRDNRVPEWVAPPFSFPIKHLTDASTIFVIAAVC
jgi:hypothetical protein